MSIIHQSISAGYGQILTKFLGSLNGYDNYKILTLLKEFSSNLDGTGQVQVTGVTKSNNIATGAAGHHGITWIL